MIRKLFLVLFFLASLSASYAGSLINSADFLSSSNSTQDKIKRVLQLEKSLSLTHPVSIKQSGKVVNLKQKLDIKRCELELKTYSIHGLVWRDKYNLSKVRILNKVIRFKGLYALTFGVRANSFQRSHLLFETKKGRKDLKSELSKLNKLCRKLGVKGFFKKIRRNNENQEKKKRVFVGKIPQGFEEMEGKVFTNNISMKNLTGEKSFIERINSLEEAKKSIFVQSLLFRADFSGQMFADLMIKRKSEGVDVKVMIDSLFGLYWDTRSTVTQKKNNFIMFNNMMAAGIRVYGYACSGKSFSSEWRGADFFKIFRRDHQKTWIIDYEFEDSAVSKMAITGGMNLTDGYFGLFGRNLQSLRDHDVALKGPIVNEMAKTYLATFKDKALRFRATKYDKNCFNPYDPIDERRKYLKFREEKTKPFVKTNVAEEIFKDLIVESNIPVFLGGELLDSTLEDDFQLKRPEFVPVKGARFILMRPEEKESYILPAYLDLIGIAKKDIAVANAFFIPPVEFKKALILAAKRGVKVKIITNSMLTNDIPIHLFVGRARYIDYFEGKFFDEFTSGLNDTEKMSIRKNIEIWEFQGRRSELDSMSRGLYHSKYMVVDREVSIVGSYNLTGSSENNAETAVIFESQEISGELKDIFSKDRGYSKRITIEQMREFQKPKKIGERIKLRLLQAFIEKLL